MGRRFLWFWVFSLSVLFSGPLAATDVIMENNTETETVRVRITNLNDASEILYESVPSGVFLALTQINTAIVNRFDFYVYDVADVSESNLLVYAEVWNSEMTAAANDGLTLHVSVTQGMAETSVGRIILGNSTSVDVDWNGNTIAAYSTNSFQVPSAAYSLAEWDTVTRPWGWMASVRFLQPVVWANNAGALTADQQKMLWLHEHDPQQWVTYYWDFALQDWAFGSLGNLNEGPGTGGGSGGGSGGGGSGGGGSGGGGAGGGGATGTGNVGGNTITINLDGVALETTQLRNEQELIKIRQNAETNNVATAAMLALMNGATTPSDPVVIQNEAESAAAAQLGVSEAESSSITDVFSQLVNVTGMAGSVPHSAFVIEFQIGASEFEINWDPREIGGLVLVLDLFKALICLLIFYLGLSHCWRWYDKKMGEMAGQQNTGTAGEAVLGTNANLVTSAINATIIVAVVGTISVLLVSFIVSSLTGSMVGNYFTSTELLDGTHTLFSNGPVLAAMVFVDMILPVNCIISVCFVVMTVEVLGHYVWLGGSWVIKYANA